MIPRHLHQIWLGGPMPADIERMRVALLARHHGWLHSLWTDENIGALGLNADRLKDEFGTWAAASNFVRLLVLQRHGGIYLDSDFESLKPLDPLLEMGDCLAAEQDGGRICNAFMAARPNHPWINWQLANFGKYDRRDAASGVYVASDAPRELVAIVPQHWVYPYLYDWPAEKRVPHAESLLVHRWDGSWVKR